MGTRAPSFHECFIEYLLFPAGGLFLARLSACLVLAYLLLVTWCVSGSVGINNSRRLSIGVALV